MLETNDSEKKAILLDKRYNGRPEYWTVIHTRDSLHPLTRDQLVRRAIDMDFEAKTKKDPRTASDSELMEFLRYA